MTRRRRSVSRASWRGTLWCLSVVLAGGHTACTSSGERIAGPYSHEPPPLRPQPHPGSVSPPSPNVLYAMAKLLAAQGKEQECAFTLHRIISEHPRFLPAYCELSELHLRNGRLDEAEAVLAAGLAIVPDEPTLVNNLAICQIYRENYEAAVEGFTRVAAYQPDNAQYRSNLAVALGLMGRYEEALALYKQIVPVEDAYHNLSVLCNNGKEPLDFLASDEQGQPEEAPGSPMTREEPETLLPSMDIEKAEEQHLAVKQVETP